MEINPCLYIKLHMREIYYTETYFTRIIEIWSRLKLPSENLNRGSRESARETNLV